MPDTQVRIRDGERIDDLQRNGYRLIQNPKMFCFGMDAVLLGIFARALPDEDVLDLCTGNGVIPVLLKARGKGRNTGPWKSIRTVRIWRTGIFI